MANMSRWIGRVVILASMKKSGCLSMRAKGGSRRHQKMMGSSPRRRTNTG